MGPLRHRDFRLLWIGLALGATASWIQQITTSWLILELTGSPLALGLSGLFMSIPFLVTSLYGGALADRMDRRKLLLIAQTAETLFAIAPAILSALGVIEVWHLYVLSFLNWTAAAFDSPARQALIPSLVPRDELPRAIALTATLRRMTALVGPMIGGLTLTALGPAGGFWVYALFNVAMLVALVAMRAPQTAFEPRGASMARSIVDGLGYVRGHRVMFAMMAMEALMSLLAHYPPMLPVFARDVLHVGPIGLGMLYTAPGVGALAASFLMVAVGDLPRRGLVVQTMYIVKPIVVTLFAFSPWMPTSLALLAVMGAVDVIGGTMRNTILQLLAHEHMRGRVMGMDTMVTRGLGPLSGVPAGAIASAINAPIALAAGASVVLVYALALLVRVPEIRQVDLRRARPVPVAQPVQG